MGNYNDFDLNIKNIQTQKEDENLRFTSIYTCGDSCSCGDTCYNTCGGLQTSCSGHCRYHIFYIQKHICKSVKLRLY